MQPFHSSYGRQIAGASKKVVGTRYLQQEGGEASSNKVAANIGTNSKGVHRLPKTRRAKGKLRLNPTPTPEKFWLQGNALTKQLYGDNAVKKGCSHVGKGYRRSDARSGAHQHNCYGNKRTRNSGRGAADETPSKEMLTLRAHGSEAVRVKTARERRGGGSRTRRRLFRACRLRKEST